MAKKASKAAKASESGGLVRLNKYLADNGVASRRKADEMIANGDVMIDGEIVTELGTKVDPSLQRVEVDGVLMRPEGERHQYYLLNKPAGVICTSQTRETRPRAIDLITDRKKGRIYPVGRLDEDTIGLIILTNDGEFAHRIQHPKYGVTKTYRVTVGQRVDDGTVQKLREGVHVAGFKSHFVKVGVQKRSDNQTVLIVTLQEGRNREIRRVFARVGLKVGRLRRIAIGNLGDRGLKVGHWRPMLRKEVKELLALTEPGALEAADEKPRRAHGARRPGGAAKKRTTDARRRDAGPPRRGGRTTGGARKGKPPGGRGRR